jgi:APA family basic amino acid/polyamine antiporter
MSDTVKQSAGTTRTTIYNAGVSQTSTNPHTLERRLGPFDAAAIVISNVIGVGIFTSPGYIAQIVAHPVGIISVWLIGGLLAFAGAMAYAELAALRPQSGGEYVYLREAYGPIAGFLTGWTSFVAGFTGAIALGALAVSEYIARFVPAAKDPTPIVSLPLGLVTLTLSPRTIVATAAIVALTLIHVRGLGPGRIVQNVLAAAKVGALLLLVALGLAVGRGSVPHAEAGQAIFSMNWLAALIPVMFSYSGWNAAAYVAEEIRDPGRNVPRALALGTAAVVVLYLGVNALYLYALPVQEIAHPTGGQGDLAVAIAATTRLLGPGAADVLAAVVVVVLLASISAMTIAGPRVYFAMAQDGAFFPAAARVHPRFKTPAVAIAAQAIWSVILVLSGNPLKLIYYTGFAVVLFSGLAVSALFVLRVRYPNEPRPFKAWGYPVAPAIFVVASLIILINHIRTYTADSLSGMALMAAGIPLYFVFKATKRRQTSRENL